MLTLSNLEQLRAVELTTVLQYFPSGSTILELGAGTGWQARELALRGFTVSAIDVPQSAYKDNKVWKVIEYDGNQIPFPDCSFDVVFSSNVLEHVPNIGFLHEEMKRVLKAEGIAVHVLPTTGWRFWTNIVHFPSVVIRLCKDKHYRSGITNRWHQGNALVRVKLLRELSLPRRHGERGMFLTEMYYFGRSWWQKNFLKSGWNIRYYCTNELFYSGYGVFDSALSIKSRRQLSRLLGSSCHVFVLTK
jgi:SAM-dependent methyltransferase